MKRIATAKPRSRVSVRANVLRAVRGGAVTIPPAKPKKPLDPPPPPKPDKPIPIPYPGDTKE